MMIRTVSDFRRAVRNGPYAWPGGYPCYWITADGGALAFDVCKTHRRSMLQAIADQDSSGWRVVALDINWEDDTLVCDHTGKRIESAYGEE